MVTTTLFEFLRKNREIPQRVQLGYRQATLLPFESDEDKAFALLHDCYYTQSSVRLNIAKEFFSKLASEPSSLSSFESFCQYLKADAKYESMHQKLSNSNCGWGPKTSALFFKNVFQIHHCPGPLSKLKFWHDTPDLIPPDRLYLPVDAVITKVFEYLQLPGKPFDAINAYLQRQQYQIKDLEIWDDLWFWGFITQEGSGADRKIVEFNEGKYWSILHAPKDSTSLQIIRKLCMDFYKILQSEKAH
jgi:hypothetical protein